MSNELDTTANPAETAPRKIPEIPRENVRKDIESLTSTIYQVRLPQGIIFQDLNHPEIWRLVQLDRGISLRRLDELRIADYDENWLAVCFVAQAGDRGVSITKPQKFDLPPRNLQPALETEEYRVSWVGTGFAVIRKRDSLQVSTPMLSAALAERDLRAQYPTQHTGRM